ncbi:hypothetical protein [Flavobacterium sp. I3-2]|uniref:hypothetical protein n=1 Tax=Flavobacterium sp. I3-2 TaxID=2748319 RepID=UPI0015ADDED0|nr:hypothetical protein [Flavobacterium sp. I3-2]
MLKRLSILLVLTSLSAKAQIQNYNWNFGNNQGFSWKNSERKTLTGMYGIPNETLYDLPVYQVGSVIKTLEGCFTISDYNGDLVMYSDGKTLWDKNNIQLTNGSGLSGDASSAQSGTIVPYPHSYDKFLVLSLGKESQNNLAFSVVEKNATDPLIYEVKSTAKNIYLTGHSGLLGETVTAGRHSNKNDIWVLAVGRGNGTTPTNTTGHPYLNVWKLSDDSPTNNSINWTFTTALDLGNQGVIGNAQPNGYIRFTNDSKHFVWANFGFGGNIANGGVPFICYGDFNNTTGAISNVRIKRGIQEDSSNGYGVEFTNDNKYLYITFSPPDIPGNQSSALLVFNFNDLLAANTATEIANITPIKKIVTPPSDVISSGNAFFGAIQTGPDGRMYIASPAKKEVFVIDNPKDPVNLRMYKLPNPINGSGGTGSYDRYGSYWGLPNFAVPWYNTAIEIPQVPNSICVDKEMPFNLYIIDGHGFDKVVKMEVDYGDGSQTKEYTGSAIAPGLKNESHTYKTIGEFKIKINSYDINNEIVNTTVKTIYINSCVLKANPYLRGEIE